MTKYLARFCHIFDLWADRENEINESEGKRKDVVGPSIPAGGNLLHSHLFFCAAA